MQDVAVMTWAIKVNTQRDRQTASDWYTPQTQSGELTINLPRLSTQVHDDLYSHRASTPFDQYKIILLVGLFIDVCSGGAIW